MGGDLEDHSFIVSAPDPVPFLWTLDLALREPLLLFISYILYWRCYIISKEDDDHKEQDKDHQHEAGLGKKDGPRKCFEAATVDGGEERWGCEGDGGLETAQQCVDLAEVYLGNYLREQRPDDSGDLRAHDATYARWNI